MAINTNKKLGFVPTDEDMVLLEQLRSDTGLSLTGVIRLAIRALINERKRLTISGQNGA